MSSLLSAPVLRAVSCLRALRKTSGWKSSDRSAGPGSRVPALHLSTQPPKAIHLAMSPLNHCTGLLDPEIRF